MDFLFKLSSELLILFLAAGVAALNWFYFSFAGAASFQDQSLASNYLAMHQQYNPKLYAKNSSIVTVISSNSFVPQAQAEDFLDNQGLASDESNPYDGGDLVIGDENGILAPNPDSVQSLIKKQIKIYQTQPGDTLQSIAQNFGISQQTIMWANKLTSQTIKPGWQLIILPTDGVLVQATNNDTLPDIAHRYNPQKYNTNAAVREQAANQLLQNIISYNALDGAEDITGGDLIIVPGGQIIAPPAPPAPPKTQPKGNSKSSIDNDINTVTSLGDGYDGVNHLFPKGYCTYYVATRMKITFGGNAKNWLANARASGYVTGSQAASHSAVVFAGYGYGKYGHVAYVEEVSGGKILVSEMNYDRFNQTDQRWISVSDPSIRVYIYP